MASMNQSVLRESIQDEIWMIMQTVVKMGSDRELSDLSPFQFESEVDEEEIQEDSNNEKIAMEEKYLATAQALIEIGDHYTESHAQQLSQKQLVNEIVAYLCEVGKPINEKLGEISTPIRPSSVIFQSGILGGIYSVFRTKMANFLGGGQSIDKIAVVSSVTQGVAHGLGDSSPLIKLVSALASKLIMDTCEDYIVQHGGLIKLTAENPKMSHGDSRREY